MDISVVITCFNEQNHIASCLESILRQDYKGGLFEVVVADGASRDRTQELVSDFCRRDRRVRLLLEPKKGAAAGRNTGIKAAAYEHIAFIDADCMAPADWLTILAEEFQKARRQDGLVAAVGGINLPPKGTENRFQDALGVALDSFIGSFGSVQGRRYDKARYVTSLPTLNVLFEKKILYEVDCFDESLMSEAEDADLNYRLSRAGWRFWFTPRSMVWHHHRLSSWPWLKNMFRYGKGRARLLKRHPAMWHINYTLPLFFLGCLFSVILAAWWPVFWLALLYFPALIVASVWQCLIKKHLKLMPRVLMVYLIQHFAYAAGEAYGLLNPKVR